METLMDAQGGSFETHKAEGEKLYRQGEYKKSLESFSTVSSSIGNYELVNDAQYVFVNVKFAVSRV